MLFTAGERATMRAQVFVLVAVATLGVAGCAMPDWMVPRFWKTPASTPAARQAQQDRYDRRVKKWGADQVNPMRSSEYVPGSSSNPFVPTQVSPQ
jgi:hypothetical protein